MYCQLHSVLFGITDHVADRHALHLTISDTDSSTVGIADTRPKRSADRSTVGCTHCCTDCFADCRAIHRTDCCPISEPNFCTHGDSDTCAVRRSVGFAHCRANTAVLRSPG